MAAASSPGPRSGLVQLALEQLPYPNKYDSSFIKEKQERRRRHDSLQLRMTQAAFKR
jgi:hypothetical protein